MILVVCVVLVCITVFASVVTVCNTVETINTPDNPPVEHQVKQETLDDDALRDKIPTFDELLNSVNSLIGGDNDDK